MRQITFLGSTSSNYLFGKGRGKDKKRRKQRRENAIAGAGAGLLGGGLGVGLAELTSKGSSLTPKQRLVTGAIALGGSTLVGAGLGSTIFNGKKPLLKIEKRTPLTDARDFVVGGKDFLKESNIKNPKNLFNAGRDIYNRKRDSSSVATKSTAALGAALGAKAASRLGMSPATGALIGAFNLSTIGSAADREISKEKARYRKEGARSRLGKIVNDTKIGAKSTAGFFATTGAIHQVRRSLAKPGNLPIKTKILGAIGSGVGGAIYGGAKGALLGGTIGSGVGTIRGFRQKNKDKKKK